MLISMKVRDLGMQSYPQKQGGNTGNPQQASAAPWNPFSSFLEQAGICSSGPQLAVEQKARKAHIDKAWRGKNASRKVADREVAKSETMKLERHDTATHQMEVDTSGGRSAAQAGGMPSLDGSRPAGDLFGTMPGMGEPMVPGKRLLSNLYLPAGAAGSGSQGTWEKAYHNSSGPRRDALELLLGIIPTQDITSPSVSSAHIEGCVPVAPIAVFPTLPSELPSANLTPMCTMELDERMCAGSPLRSLAAESSTTSPGGCLPSPAVAAVTPWADELVRKLQNCSSPEQGRAICGEALVAFYRHQAALDLPEERPCKRCCTATAWQSR